MEGWGEGRVCLCVYVTVCDCVCDCVLLLEYPSEQTDSLADRCLFYQFQKCFVSVFEI